MRWGSLSIRSEKMTAWASMLFIVLAYPCGVLVDRWGCQKTFILSLALMAVSPLLMFFFAHDRHATVVWFIIRSTPTNLAFLALAKWTVEVYPQDRYGQFASAGRAFFLHWWHHPRAGLRLVDWTQSGTTAFFCCGTRSSQSSAWPRP